MTIEEIKKALREVRSICTESSYCTNCPLSVDGSCPMRDELGETVEFPEYWALDWNDD